MNLRFCIGALPLTLLPLAGEAELHFAPEAGTSATKTFTEASSWELEDVQIRAQGQPVDQAVPEMSGSATRTLVVTDEYTAVADGRPTKLGRRFDTIEGENELEMSVDTMAESYSVDFDSELAEQSVHFAWNEEQKRFDCKNAAGESSRALEGLLEDLDLRGLLPGKEVEVLDSWELEPQALVDVLRMGGDTGLRHEGQPSGDFFLLTPAQVLMTTLLSPSNARTGTGGELSATWDETTKEGEHELAVITIEGELEAEGDLSDRLEFLLGEVGAEDSDFIVNAEWALECEGQLVWNLTLGRFESFRLESETTIQILAEWEMEFNGMAIDNELEASLSGTSLFEAAAKRE